MYAQFGQRYLLVGEVRRDLQGVGVRQPQELTRISADRNDPGYHFGPGRHEIVQGQERPANQRRLRDEVQTRNTNAAITTPTNAWTVVDNNLSRSYASEKPRTIC